MADRTLTDWLLDSDPALRWQVERDLLGAPEEAWAATRARVATEGFGARLLALQDTDGQLAGGYVSAPACAHRGDRASPPPPGGRRPPSGAHRSQTRRTVVDIEVIWP